MTVSGLPDGSGTILLGPPLFNLERKVLRVLRRALRMSWFSRIRLLRHDRHLQLRIGPIRDANLPVGLFRQDRLVVQPNCADVFRGRRVVVTLSRDNELQWIGIGHGFLSGSTALMRFCSTTTLLPNTDPLRSER